MTVGWVSECGCVSEGGFGKNRTDPVLKWVASLLACLRPCIALHTCGLRDANQPAAVVGVGRGFLLPEHHTTHYLCVRTGAASHNMIIQLASLKDASITAYTQAGPGHL